MRDHPLLRRWLATTSDACAIPNVAGIEARMRAAQAHDGIRRPAACAQTPQLLGDGLHYETRIALNQSLSTRDGSAHDYFNALAWIGHPALKHALNARQVADIARVGVKQRTRGQCALTHFDEAGAIVWLADASLLAAWDSHDWQALFVDERVAWGPRIAVTVFGHALLEHVWNGQMLPVAKALAVVVDAQRLARHDVADDACIARWPELEAIVAAAVRDGDLLTDPQQLRPLPLAGIAGWHARSCDADFIATAPCFRPLRPHRRYPPPFDARSTATRAQAPLSELLPDPAVSFATPR